MVRVSVDQLQVPTIDLTGRDFASTKQSIIDYIEARFPDLISELGDQSLLTVLIEVNCYVADVLNFYIDQQANETYIGTARQRNNIIRLARLVGYEPRAASPSTVTLTATIVPASSSPIVIPKGTRISIDNLFFEVLSEVTIPADTESYEFDVVEGRTYTEEFTSTGAKFQRFTLGHSPVIVPAIEVSVDGVVWDKVSTIPFSSVEADSVNTYVTDLDGDDVASITFGEGTLSAIPARDATISIEYRIGGGIRGNLAISAIKTSIPAYINGTDLIQLQVENLIAGSGGVDRETTDSIKLNAPTFTRLNDRLVSRIDYESIPLIFSSEHGAIVRTRAEVLSATGKGNEVNVYAWTRGTDGVIVAPGTELLSDLDDFIDERKQITVQHHTIAGSLKNVTIDATISVLPGFDEAEVVAAVEDAFQELFNSDEFQKLDIIRRFDLFGILCEAAGVKFADLIFPTSDISLDVNEAAVIGSLTVDTV